MRHWVNISTWMKKKSIFLSLIIKFRIMVYFLHSILEILDWQSTDCDKRSLTLKENISKNWRICTSSICIDPLWHGSNLDIYFCVKYVKSNIFVCGLWMVLNITTEKYIAEAESLVCIGGKERSTTLCCLLSKVGITADWFLKMGGIR